MSSGPSYVIVAQHCGETRSRHSERTSIQTFGEIWRAGGLSTEYFQSGQALQSKCGGLVSGRRDEPQCNSDYEPIARRGWPAMAEGWQFTFIGADQETPSRKARS